jgi:hypothetical protein
MSKLPSEIKEALKFNVAQGKTIAEAINIISDKFEIRRSDVELIAELEFPSMMSRPLSQWEPAKRSVKQ